MATSTRFTSLSRLRIFAPVFAAGLLWAACAPLHAAGDAPKSGANPLQSMLGGLKDGGLSIESLAGPYLQKLASENNGFLTTLENLQEKYTPLSPSKFNTPQALSDLNATIGKINSTIASLKSGIENGPKDLMAKVKASGIDTSAAQSFIDKHSAYFAEQQTLASDLVTTASQWTGKLGEITSFLDANKTMWKPSGPDGKGIKFDTEALTQQFLKLLQENHTVQAKVAELQDKLTAAIQQQLAGVK